jgi:CRP-like cAMP-binding protein
MSQTNEKTTIYLNPYVKKFIQHKAIEENTSISSIINDLFARKLSALNERAELSVRRKEPTVPFDKVLAEMGLSYEDLRD